jgi:hypothetical protein
MFLVSCVLVLELSHEPYAAFPTESEERQAQTDETNFPSLPIIHQALSFACNEIFYHVASIGGLLIRDDCEQL